ncbi:MaoC family dehydratase N-terminal domain-containing protein [Phenylobacterium sp. SCN 70-31]|uniref:FAS1-like dehydratase domain-containing protein n=1 Tax=Phenylobacterium sp. SCN 70-31 TaxID=1660129 RepID=UPI00086F5E1B|nr:MaoC family dehydratase N-terminal domain-containing protein [Phenylobacterium sp. SCN 70-31]ODT88322.1 MAG: hypothetical protein ABS78_06775 [Phenylobacterium sp. SCN 70-31]
MSTEVTDRVEEATSATFRDEDVELTRSLIGKEFASPAREQWTEASHDTMRAYSRAAGDDNPLFCDREYGKRTRWSGQIAAPFMVRAINNPLRGEKPPRQASFRGIHQFVSGQTIDWYLPIREGDKLFKFGGIEGLTPKESSFAGRSLIKVDRWTHINQRGEVVAVSRPLMVMTERKAARERKKLADLELANYSPEDIARHDAIYAAEQPRYGEPRYWEDVEVGDRIGPAGGGPLTMTDIIFWHAGGVGFRFNPGSGRMAYKNRQRMPAFYVPNDQGVPDIAQRVHWDSSWARAIGAPSAYDYSVMREAWLAHVLTDWMGDDGWMCHMHAEVRKFNYIGDLHVFTGQVMKKRHEDGRAIVDVRVAGVNQRGEESCHAVAAIALPSRDHGPVQLPQPPADLARRALEFMIEHNRRTHGE